MAIAFTLIYFISNKGHLFFTDNKTSSELVINFDFG